MITRARKLALNLIPVAVVMFAVVATKMLEPVLFPVVSSFLVHDIYHKDQLVTISGTMIKERNCRFESVTAYSLFGNGAEKQRIPVVFLDGQGDDAATRASGAQRWGPWRITIPVSPQTVAIELTSLHSCHWLWGQTTHLADVPLSYTKE